MSKMFWTKKPKAPPRATPNPVFPVISTPPPLPQKPVPQPNEFMPPPPARKHHDVELVSTTVESSAPGRYTSVGSQATMIADVSTPRQDKATYTSEDGLMKKIEVVVEVDARQVGSLLDTVFSATRERVEKLVTEHDNPKSLARKIIKVLQEEFGLTTSVNITAFIAQQESESVKAKSQLAIATQRAAALFALEKNLLETTKQGLENHIEVTKKSNNNDYFPADYQKYFVAPLEVKLEELEKNLKLAEDKTQTAQKDFERLRQDATRPIMEELQKGNREYTHIFHDIPSLDLDLFCDAVDSLEKLSFKDDAFVRQKISNFCAPNSVQYLQIVYANAFKSQPQLSKLLLQVQESCRYKDVTVRVEMGELKAVERAMEKTVEEYGGDFSRLLDIARGSMECESVQDATEVVNVIRTMAREGNPHGSSMDLTRPDTQVVIVRVKNRLHPQFPAASESGGYRDVLLNVRLPGGHVCELQIHIKQFSELKKSGGHKTYTIARSLHLLDPELSHVRVAGGTINDGKGDKVRPALEEALHRVANGTCQSLHLNHVKLTVAECRAIRDALCSPASNVRELFMPKCDIDEERSTVLCEGVEKLGDFRVVDLHANQGITGQCVSIFVSSELEQFSIDECRLDASNSVLVVHAFVKHKPKRMVDLNFRETVLGCEGAKQFAGALAEMTSLTSLNLFGNRIGDEGVKHLAPVLKTMKGMKHLNLWSNRIGVDGAHHLADVLCSMPSMKVLTLGNNSFGPKGVEKIAPSFETLKNLLSLDLSGNKVGAEGAKHLVVSLVKMPSVTSVNLKMNELGNDGAGELVKAAEQMKTLIALELLSNGIDDDTKESVAATLKHIENLDL